MSESFKKVGTINVRNAEHDVFVSDEMKFFCVVDGAKVFGASTDALVERMMVATKRASVKANIEFWRWRNNKLQKGTATCLHASNGNLVVKWEGDKTVDQECHYYRGTQLGKFMRLTESERQHLTNLYTVELAARQDREKFEKAHSFDAVKEVRDLVEKDGGAS